MLQINVRALSLRFNNFRLKNLALNKVNLKYYSTPDICNLFKITNTHRAKLKTMLSKRNQNLDNMLKANSDLVLLRKLSISQHEKHAIDAELYEKFTMATGTATAIYGLTAYSPSYIGLIPLIFFLSMAYYHNRKLEKLKTLIRQIEDTNSNLLH